MWYTTILSIAIHYATSISEHQASADLMATLPAATCHCVDTAHMQYLFFSLFLSHEPIYCVGDLVVSVHPENWRLGVRLQA